MEHILFGIAILVLIILFVSMPFIIRGIGHPKEAMEFGITPGLLEVVEAHESLDDIGGLENQKDYLLSAAKKVKVALPVGCHGCQSLNCPRNPERHTPLVD